MALFYSQLGQPFNIEIEGIDKRVNPYGIVELTDQEENSADFQKYSAFLIKETPAAVILPEVDGAKNQAEESSLVEEGKPSKGKSK